MKRSAAAPCLLFLIAISVLALAVVRAVAQSPAPSPIPLRAGDPDGPSLTPFLPAKRATDAAVIVIPGGGYSSLSVTQEGEPAAKWLSDHGIPAFMLRYRVAPKFRQPAAFEDAQLAIRVLRARAAEWNVRPDQVGVLGFSAGGHLASTVGTHFDDGKPDAADPVARQSSRPAFLGLVYPVITMFEFAHAGSRTALLGEAGAGDDALRRFYSGELNVTAKTPPTFLVHATGDKTVPVENSLLFASALRKAGVPFELHVYQGGRHGFGLAASDPIIGAWKDAFLAWFGRNGFVPAASERKP